MEGKQLDRKEVLKLLGLETASITCLVQSNKRRLHIIYPDNTERIDEYDLNTHELLLRKWKRKSTIKESIWEYEIHDHTIHNYNNQTLQASSKAPIFIRKDTLNEFQFRIRNLNYDASVFIVNIEDNHIVIKTTIKKYYKKIKLVELERMSIALEQNHLKWLFKNNTLLITYQKPKKFMQVQEIMMMEFTRMNMRKPKDGDIECNIQ